MAISRFERKNGRGDESVHAALGQRFLHLIALGEIHAEEEHRDRCGLAQVLHRVGKRAVAQVACEQEHVGALFGEAGGSLLR